MFLRANYPTIIKGFRGVFVFSAGLKFGKFGKINFKINFIYIVYN